MATLIIDTWSSSCGACGKGADPNESQHDTVLDYSGPSEGCHEHFDNVYSNYGERLRAAAEVLRPDLPWRDYSGEARS